MENAKTTQVENVQDAKFFSELPTEFKVQGVLDSKGQPKVRREEGKEIPVTLESAFFSEIQLFVQKVAGWKIPEAVVNNEITRQFSAGIIGALKDEVSRLSDSLKGQTDVAAMMKTVEKIAELNKQLKDMGE